MKRKRTLLWILAGITTLFIGWIAMKGLAHVWSSHGYAASQAFGNGGFRGHGGAGSFGI